MEICPIHQKVLVCPTCLAIERGSRGGKRRGETRIPKEKTPKASALVCTAKDVMKIFEAQPFREFNSEALRLELPSEKQAVTSRTEISRRLTYLHKIRSINRVGDGIYLLYATSPGM